MTTEILRQVLNQLGLATLVVSQNLDVRFFSTAAKNILDQADGLHIVNNQLQTSSALEGVRLRKLLSEAVKTHTQNADHGNDGIDVEMHVSRPSNKHPLHLRIMPLTHTHAESTESEHVIILIRDLEANFTGLINRLQDKFHLTPRECECATLLTEGLPPNKIAKLMHISEHTFHEHLKHMYLKMQVNKQHELVAKLLHLQRQR